MARVGPQRQKGKRKLSILIHYRFKVSCFILLAFTPNSAEVARTRIKSTSHAVGPLSRPNVQHTERGPSQPAGIFNLVKPTRYAMHQQFKIQQLYALPTLYLCVCICLRTNSDLCHLQHKLIGFYSRDEKCLQRGTDWGFK